MIGAQRDKVLLLLLFIVSGALIFSQPPIAQDQNYHQFADSRSLFGLNNALDVLSNLPFLLVGVWGLIRCRDRNKVPVQLPIFYLGVALVAISSAYYHYAPSNETLLWDRLPMTIAFMSLFSLLVAEKIEAEFARRMLPFLLLAGIGSVLYWHLGELNGVGDLRAYVLVQFFPMLAIVTLLLSNRQNRALNRAYYALLVFYLLAKAGEHYDQPIFAATGLLSGHSLKHILAATGIALFLRLHFKQSA